mmetsp:Transcript_3774/g.8465  ORF Transcript_3774/g.8465 Transcript_3774/m.8465 type:complete len:536 (+) Transcript_3774:98-1705(+)
MEFNKLQSHHENSQRDSNDRFKNDAIELNHRALSSVSQSDEQHSDTDTHINHPRTLARVLVCISHFFSEISEWIWQFSTVVWLTSLGRDDQSISLGSSLFLNSSYSATSQVLVFLLVPRITKYVNNSSSKSTWLAFSRKKFMSRIILGQIPCLLFATLLFGRELSNDSLQSSNGIDGNGDRDESNRQSTILLGFVSICLFSGLAQVLQSSYKVSIERDWIVAMSENDGQLLESNNVLLNQIHLICIICGPSIAVLLHSHSDGWSLVCVSLIKIISLILMNALIKRTYSMIPSLQNENEQQSSTSVDENCLDDNSASSNMNNASSISSTWGCVEDIRVYIFQKELWAGVALAFLYCNVMTFGGLLMAYLNSCGLTWEVIGLCQGASNFAGLLGTCIFALLQRFLNDVRATALCGICWQFMLLSVSMFGVLMKNPWFIIVGVIPSRIGLWIYAIASTQLFQQTVPEKERGKVGGVQTSLNSLFQTIPLILGMIYSDVDDYWKVLVTSYLSNGTAVLMVLFGVYLPCRKSNLSYSTVD